MTSALDLFLFACFRSTKHNLEVLFISISFFIKKMQQPGSLFSLLAIGIALLTVSFQTIRAAKADPVRLLRYE